MKRLSLIIVALVIVGLMGCATVNLIPETATPQRTYYEAQQAFFNAWETYYAFWTALPETDARKVEWVEKYHPLFLEAAQLLKEWGEMPNDPDAILIVNAAINRLESILVSEAIKRGGK